MAELSSSDINDLPDSDFAYIEPGGTKDSTGRTTPRSLRHFPIHDAAHVRNALARASQSPFGDKAMPKIKAAAKKLGIDVGEEEQQKAQALQPIAGLCVRATSAAPTFEVIDGSKPKLTGYLAVFDQWAEVNSRLEGQFMERMAHGAFTNTLRNNRDRLRVLFNHGEDPQIGAKPLGTISRLEEDQRGVAYEVDLFDVDYVRSLLPALEAGQFGSSFTFRPIKDKRQVVHRPQRSDWNPEGLPEVTVQELNMREFGPCMFPVYAGTSAGLRSMTDEYVFGHLASDPQRLRELLSTVSPTSDMMSASTEALSTKPSRGDPLATGQSRNVQLTVPVRKFHTSEDFVEWLNSKT